MKFVGCQMFAANHANADKVRAKSTTTTTTATGESQNWLKNLSPFLCLQCANAAGLFTNVDHCMSTALGTKLQLRAEQITKRYSPSFVPTIVYNHVSNIHTHIHTHTYYICLQLVSLPIWSSTGIQSAAAGQLCERFPVHRLLYAAQTDRAPRLSVPIKSELRVQTHTHTHASRCMCMRMHVTKNTAGVKLEIQHVKIKKHKNKTKYFIDLPDNSVAFYTLVPLKLANKGYTSFLWTYVTGWKRPHEYTYIFLLKYGMDLTISICLFEPTYLSFYKGLLTI